MHRALAFCRKITLSKALCEEFTSVIEAYHNNSANGIENFSKPNLKIETKHIDGTLNAKVKDEKISWLKENSDDDVCRLLSNVRCLSEGVDVPALDAILFIHPRKSQIDVVQAVGRVMRRADGKERGYVIVPVAIPSGIPANKALDNNERYKVVWQILNALRSHDERMNSAINAMRLGEDVSDKIEIVDGTAGAIEAEATTAVVKDIHKPIEGKKQDPDIGVGDAASPGQGAEGEQKSTDSDYQQSRLMFPIFAEAIRAKIVGKYSTDQYWKEWAKDIGKIAQQHIVRIRSIVTASDSPASEVFQKFLAEVRDDLNPQVSEDDAIEMLAQHIITRPVFEVLFEGNEFAANNPVSKALDLVLSRIDEYNLDKESEALEKFYTSVKHRAAGIKSITGRQKIIAELYDKFFRNAFPLITQKLGIVYTPVKIVDFIIRSVEDIMQEEFNSSLGDRGVHIIDPFTGTGTFITRLLQADMLSKQQIKRKFIENELHANEIVLLAYYIACVNIESVYKELMKEYSEFKGMVLTDTFQLYEQEQDMIADLMPDNSERRTKQKNRQITAVMTNPPYSIGQKDTHDNAANTKYVNLDRRIKETYAKFSTASLKKGLYDSYVRALRWATERIDGHGVIGFIVNASWISSRTGEGLRKCFAEDFAKIYVVDLQGSLRIKREGANKKEEDVFGGATRTPVAIVLLVKRDDKKQEQQTAEIFYYDISDYLSRDEKLSEIAKLSSIRGIRDQRRFTLIKPNKNNDWFNQRSAIYQNLLPLVPKRGKKSAKSCFAKNGPGIATNRDVWVYNYSRKKLATNIKLFINEYNTMLAQGLSLDRAMKTSQNIKWTRALKRHYENNKSLEFQPRAITQVLYRPFTTTNLYLQRSLIEGIGKAAQLFFSSDESLGMIISDPVDNGTLSVLMAKHVCDLQVLRNDQILPRFYKEKERSDSLLPRSRSKQLTSGITEYALEELHGQYKDQSISKDDYFFYLYAMLHSAEYKEKFKNDLTKEYPRVFLPKSYQTFTKFVNAGKSLAKLHTDYEEVEPYKCSFKEGDLSLVNPEDEKDFFRVTEMKFADKKDKSRVIYNNNITIQGIPKEAWDYVVNEYPAPQWVMEMQLFKHDKDTGIINDPNDYANETMKNPRYPLELFLRVITVSLETRKIIRALPELGIK